MIFGSFANFAQNAWGLTLVLICQLILALSFFSEMTMLLVDRIRLKQNKVFNLLILTLSSNLLLSMVLDFTILMFITYFCLLMAQIIDLFIIKKRKKNQQDYQSGVFENYVLFLSFACLGFLNLHKDGTGPMTVATCILLFIPFYFYRAIKKKQETALNKSGKFVLTSIYISVCIVGLSAVFKTMHYPGANFLMMFGLLINAIVIIFLLLIPKHKNTGEKITVLQFLKIPNTHVIFLFMVMTIRIIHIFFSMQGIAPGFYENRFPQVVADLRNSGKEEDAEKSDEIAEAYINFIEHCKNSNNVP